LSHSARASLARIGARSGERWLCCLPVSHVAGLQVLVRSLQSGTEPTVAATASVQALSESGCSHLSVVPTQLARLLHADRGAAALAAFSSVLVGGAAPPAGAAGGGRAGRGGGGEGHGGEGGGGGRRVGGGGAGGG